MRLAAIALVLSCTILTAGCRHDPGFLMAGVAPVLQSSVARETTAFAEFAKPHDCVLPLPEDLDPRASIVRRGPFALRPIRD